LYTSEGTSVLRYNVCTGTQEPAFATGLPAPCYSLRIRQNGEVLVVCSSEVVRPASTGMLLQNYPASSLPSASYLSTMNLYPNRTSFWTADFYNGDTYKVNITTGAVLE
jgi:hypothetical protein